MGRESFDRMVQDEIRCLKDSIFKTETQGGQEQEKSQQEQARETCERALARERQWNQQRDAKLPREGQASWHRHREAVSAMPPRVEEGCRNGVQELATHGVIRVPLEGGEEVQDDVVQWATRENKNTRAHQQKNEREQAMWREVEKALTKAGPAFGSPRRRRGQAAPGMEEGMLGEQARSNGNLGKGAQASSRISGGKDQHARSRESIRMSGGKEQYDRGGSHGLSPSSSLALPLWLTSRRERHGTPGTPRTTTSSLTGSLLHLGDYADSRQGKVREGGLQETSTEAAGEKHRNGRRGEKITGYC